MFFNALCQYMQQHRTIFLIDIAYQDQVLRKILHLPDMFIFRCSPRNFSTFTLKSNSPWYHSHSTLLILEKKFLMVFANLLHAHVRPVDSFSPVLNLNFFEKETFFRSNSYSLSKSTSYFFSSLLIPYSVFPLLGYSNFRATIVVVALTGACIVTFYVNLLALLQLRRN